MTIWLTLGWCGLGCGYPPLELRFFLLTIGCGWGDMLASYRKALQAAAEEIKRLRGALP